MGEIDRLTTEKYGIPSIILMENAAHAVVRVITKKLGGSVKEKSFLILCGKGNNGGDGAALARILWTQGANIWCYLVGKVDETTGDARVNFETLGKLALSSISGCESGLLFFEQISQSHEISFTAYDCVVDALFGTGLTKPAAGETAEIIGLYNAFGVHIKNPLIVSIDIPSGLNANSSDIVGKNIRADLTVTFTAPKPANVLPPASNYNGELVAANIGSPRKLVDESPSKLFLSEKSDARNWLEQTKFSEDSYKNKRGHALLIAGSREYNGAAVLASNAAMVSGVGLTTAATSESAQNIIAAKVSEEIITRGLPETQNGAISKDAFAEVEKLMQKADIVGIGCGLNSAEKSTKDFVRQVVSKRKTPVVIDADGLNALAPFDLKGSEKLPLILTPHEGEFLRLLGTNDREILKDRVKAARDFAKKHQVILVLKGEKTLIAAPDETVIVNPTGNSGLGKAGSGDTLTGILTGFVAQASQMKIDIFETVCAAVYIAGLAGDIAAEKLGKRTMLASDVRDCLREAFEKLSEN